MYDVTTVNPNFDPQHSTNEIWRDEDGTRCLTDDLDQIELDIANLETEVNNKAPSDHNHTGFAPSAHTHQSADVAGLADTLTAKADLVNGKVPDTQLPGCVPEIERATSFTALPATGDANKLYITTDNDKAYRWNGTGYSEISESIAIGETANTAFRGDHGKTAYDHSQAGDVHVTAEQKDAWNSKADGGHTHAVSAITGLLEMLLTDTAGRQKVTITGNVLTTIAGMAAGVYTAYSAGGTNSTATNAPNAIESWRYLIHKNYPAYGWVMAFGSEGSFFINYLDNGAWRGWKPIWDNNPSPLWTGTMFMNASQTVTPTKKLSECRNGWVLLWSDYDTTNSSATNGDVVATYIPKRCYSGGNWGGHSWVVEIPIEASATAESRCIKKLYLWDNRIVGNAINEQNSRNDVVLRAVYEF